MRPENLERKRLLDRGTSDNTTTGMEDLGANPDPRPCYHDFSERNPRNRDPREPQAVVGRGCPLRLHLLHLLGFYLRYPVDAQLNRTMTTTAPT